MQVADLFAGLGLRVNEAQWSRGTKAIEGITRGLQTMIAAVAVYEGVRWFGDQIKDTVELGSHIKNLSQSAGVSTDTLQELGYAASQNGSDMDSMAAGLGKLSRSMLAAKNGGEEQAKAFAAMGVSAVDAHGALRPTAAVLGDIADHFKKMPDGAEKTGQSMSVLGRSGASLIPTLNEGSAGLSLMAVKAHELGGVMDSETIESLHEFEQTTKDLHVTLGGLRNTMVVALLPTLKRLTSGLMTWLQANRVEIIKKLQAAAETLGRVLGWLSDIFGRVAGVLGEMITALEDALPGVDIFKTAMVAAGIAMALAWIAALGPIALIAIALVAAGLVAQDLYSSIKDGDGMFADLWATMKESLSDGTIDGLTTAFEWFGNVTKGVFGVLKLEVQEALYVLSEIKDAIMWVVDHASDLQRLLSPLTKLVPNNVMHTLSPLSMFATAQDDREDEAAHESAKGWDPSKIPGVVSPLSSLTAPFSNSLNGGITAPLSVNLTINSAGQQAGDIVDAFRTSFSSLLDEHVRHIQAATQGAKR